MGRVLRSDCNQQSVFVDNVKAMEMPEDFSATSTVWFDSVYSFYSVIPHSLYFSVAGGHVFRGVLSNGKIDMGERAAEEFPTQTKWWAKWSRALLRL